MVVFLSLHSELYVLMKIIQMFKKPCIGPCGSMIKVPSSYTI